MIFICNQCGQKHRVDPKILHYDKYQVKCRTCGFLMTIYKSGTNSESILDVSENDIFFLPPKALSSPTRPTKEKAAAPTTSMPAPDGIRRLSMIENKGGKTKVTAPRKRMIGLRFKMFFLFFFIPIILFIAASYLYMNYMKTFSGFITTESTQLITKMAEEAIAEKGRAVAREIGRYLLSHPDLKKEHFMEDSILKSIGIQKVGKTGYTCLVSKVLETEPSCLWLHPVEKLIGKDIVQVMHTTLGDGYERWYKIQEISLKTGKESSGYYMWQDKREKYMVMVPVEKTNFFIASTTYIDEFTLPMTELQTRVNKLRGAMTEIVMIVLTVAAILIALIVLFYSFKLSGRVKKLSAAAGRISLGEVDFEIDRIKSGDEIEDLADDFSRMQESIRLALERLKTR